MIVLESSNEIIVKRRIQDVRHVRLDQFGKAHFWSESGKLVFKNKVTKPACELSINDLRTMLEKIEERDNENLPKDQLCRIVDYSYALKFDESNSKVTPVSRIRPKEDEKGCSVTTYDQAKIVKTNLQLPTPRIAKRNNDTIVERLEDRARIYIHNSQLRKISE